MKNLYDELGVCGFTYEDIITYYQANKNKHISANYFILLVSILQSLREEKDDSKKSM